MDNVWCFKLCWLLVSIGCWCKALCSQLLSEIHSVETPTSALATHHTVCPVSHFPLCNNVTTATTNLSLNQRATLKEAQHKTTSNYAVEAFRYHNALLCSCRWCDRACHTQIDGQEGIHRHGGVASCCLTDHAQNTTPTQIFSGVAVDEFLDIYEKSCYQWIGVKEKSVVNMEEKKWNPASYSNGDTLRVSVTPAKAMAVQL